MFLSARERANEMKINVGDVVGFDKQSKMKQLDAKVAMELRQEKEEEKQTSS